jgi:adenylate cyclase class 2
MAGRHVFTLKRPAGNVLSCEEHETDIADRDQMHGAILAMGFCPTVRIVKVRRTAAWGDMSLCVDQLDGLGVFLEVERMVRGDVPGDVVQANLCRFVESLGIEAERIEQPYDWLVRHRVRASLGTGRGRRNPLVRAASAAGQKRVPAVLASAGLEACKLDGGGRVKLVVSAEWSESPSRRGSCR